MSRATWLNVSGTWKKIRNVWLNVNGVWKQKVIPKGYINGLRKEFIEYILKNLTFYKQISVSGNNTYGIPIVIADGDNIFVNSSWSGSSNIIKYDNTLSKIVSISSSGYFENFKFIDEHLYVLDSNGYLNLYDKNGALLKTSAYKLQGYLIEDLYLNKLYILQTSTSMVLEINLLDLTIINTVAINTSSFSNNSRLFKISAGKLYFVNANINSNANSTLYKYDLVTNTLLLNKDIQGLTNYTVDKSGFIYCTGYCMSFIKLDSNGSELTNTNIAMSYSNYAFTSSIVIHNECIYLTIYENSQHSANMVVKYDWNLNQIWKTTTLKNQDPYFLTINNNFIYFSIYDGSNCYIYKYLES